MAPRTSLRRHTLADELTRRFEGALELSIPRSCIAYRATSPGWARAHTLFDGEGASRHGGRWNLPGRRVVYLSESPEAALSEQLAHARRHSTPIHFALPAVIAWGRIDLLRVLDLTEGSVIELLGNEVLLETDSDWQAENESGVESITQRIGEVAMETGVEALRVPSAAVPRAVNLVVCLEALDPGSRLEAHGLE